MYDGWEQQHQSRSNKCSSDHLWQMETRNLSLFGDPWGFGHFRRRPKPSWFFPAVGCRAIARWGGQRFLQHLPPRQQEKYCNKVRPVQISHPHPMCFPHPLSAPRPRMNERTHSPLPCLSFSCLRTSHPPINSSPLKAVLFYQSFLLLSSFSPNKAVPLYLDPMSSSFANIVS